MQASWSRLVNVARLVLVSNTRLCGPIPEVFATGGKLFADGTMLNQTCPTVSPGLTCEHNSHRKPAASMPHLSLCYYHLCSHQHRRPCLQAHHRHLLHHSPSCSLSERLLGPHGQAPSSLGGTPHLTPALGAGLAYAALLEGASRASTFPSAASRYATACACLLA